MTKIIKKDKCSYEHGLIVKKNKVIGISKVVHLQLHQIELMYQQWDHLRRQDPYNPGPSLNGFERKSIFDTEMPYVQMPDTPAIDARCEEAMRFMDECDAVNDVACINAKIDRFRELIDWCKGDTFVEGNCTEPIDTPCLGNPLELEPHTIVAIIEAIVKTPIEIEG